jgi:hypothetical protein
MLNRFLGLDKIHRHINLQISKAAGRMTPFGWPLFLFYERALKRRGKIPLKNQL